MNKSVIGAVVLFVLVVAGALTVKLLLPVIEEGRQKATSDATKIKGKITIAVDNWVGYFPLRSPKLATLMRQAGYHLVCEDDRADYQTRMRRIKDGEIDFAVATVDSFLLNAAPFNFPGIIVMVIDESKGGDAILARKDKVKTLDDLKTRQDIRVAFTPGSPSHHLAKAAADHFNVPGILPKGDRRIETDGSEKARELLLAGKTDVAICWEPDVSKALENENIIKLLGTEDTEHLIVDILVAGRDIVKSDPELVLLLIGDYFKILKDYRENPDELLTDVRKDTGLSADAVNSMLKGVKWINFNANCENWFGIGSPGGYSSEGVVDTIDSSVRILISAGDFDQTPVPDQDPYRLINSSFLKQLYQKGFSGFTVPGESGAQPEDPVSARFTPLTTSEWDRLKEVGTLKVDPIVFQSSTTELDLLAKQVIDDAVQRLKHYPNFRIEVRGHTGTRGDPEENQRLSVERAQAVAQYLKVVYNVDPNRIRALGFGGSRPLPRKPGESTRAWGYRLPRVELVLVREDI